MEKKLDPFGVIVIAFVTAMGGGTLRDIMIGNLPVNWLHNETGALLVLGSAIVTMFFSRYLKQFTTTLFLFDALGLGLYTIIGIEVALTKNLSAGMCIGLGTITACFGGVVRDVLLNHIPLLFRKEIYALACIAGGLVYFALLSAKLYRDIVTVLSILFIFLVRLLAVKWKLSLPRFYERHSGREPDL